MFAMLAIALPKNWKMSLHQRKYLRSIKEDAIASTKVIETKRWKTLLWGSTKRLKNKSSFTMALVKVYKNKLLYFNDRRKLKNSSMMINSSTSDNFIRDSPKQIFISE
jgi:hypothetical protein